MEKNLEIFNFVNDNNIEAKKKLEMLKQVKKEEQEYLNRINKGDKIIAKAGLIALLAVGTVALSKEMKYQSQPITIVSKDMLTNVNLMEVEGKRVDAKKFDSTETKEMYDFIVENNISNDEIYATIGKICKARGIDYNFAITKLYDMYPEVFENALEDNNKTK